MVEKGEGADLWEGAFFPLHMIPRAPCFLSLSLSLEASVERGTRHCNLQFKMAAMEIRFQRNDIIFSCLELYLRALVGVPC